MAISNPMVARPYADPGYGMPNPYVGNLNQSPGMAVGGYLLANQLMQPNRGQYPLQANRLAPWFNVADELGTDYGPMADVPPNTARVPPDTMSDVSPYTRHAPVDVGNEGTSPIYPSNLTKLVDRLLNYDTHGQSFDYAEAIRRAMENRRRLGRGQ